MQSLLQDLQFSLRTLRKSPGFTLTAVLTLALGIGAVTAVFSVVNSVLLKPFAFPEEGRLVVLRETLREFNNVPLPDNYKHYLDWQKNSKTLADAAVLQNQSASISVGIDHPEMVGALSVSPNFFSVLGIQPMLGRGFLPSEATEGHDNVVILSWGAWQKYFQGSSSAIGRTLRIGGEPETVVGVLPRGFSFPHMYEISTARTVAEKQVRPYEIFGPLVPDPSQLTDAGHYNYLVVGRLKAGVSRAQAESELQGLQQSFVRAAHLPVHPGILVEPLKQEVAGSVSTELWLLLAAVASVLLIACVNLANLQMARAVKRGREMAVRAALGAGRERLARAALMDSLVLAAVGGALGILLAFHGVRLFIAAAPANLPRLNQAHVSLPILVGAAGLSTLTALLFGLFPALRAMRVDPLSAMQSNPNRMANTHDGQRIRHLLVGGQIAFTVVLLIVTGLLLRSFSRLLNQRRDFDADHIALAEVHLFNPQYGDTQPQSVAARTGFIDRALAGIARLPGVKSAAVTSEMPLTGETWVNGIERPEHPLPPEQEPNANMRWVSPEFASTLNIPLLRGRDLTAADRNHPRNVLISQQTALAGWPGEDPLGKTFQSGPTKDYTVVGIVGDARINDLKQTENMVYVPYWENPPWNLFFLVRSNQAASVLADSIRRTIWSIDPEVPIPTVKALQEQVSDSVAGERFQTTVLASFGATALLLALLGVYGVMAYTVSLRQQEFGIRLALGSGRAALIQLVLWGAMVPLFGGVLAGLVFASVAVRWIRSLLYDTSVVDPIVIASSIALLLTAALLAAMLPARRAARVDPIVALRTE